MKLLFLINNLSTGGAQRQLINLALGLKAKGHDVSFFCYNEGRLLAPDLETKQIPIYSFQKKSRFSLAVLSDLRNHIKRNKFDIILSFLNTPNFYAIVTSRLLKHRPKVIVSERFYDPSKGVSTIEKLTRLLYVFANHVTINSFHQTRTIIKKYPWLKKKITTIYNGYDLVRFSPAQDILNNGDIRAIVIARISPEKNSLCLVRALNILKKEYGIRIQVSWVGEQRMTNEHLAYRRKVDAEIKQCGLDSQWVWLGQRVDIPELLRDHDVLVHPSYGEGVPNAVCEALACGLPVIVSKTLDHPFLIQNGVNGFLFDFMNPHSLAHTLKYFYDLSGEMRKKIGIEGRRFAENNLSESRYVSEYEDLFKLLLIQNR